MFGFIDERNAALNRGIRVGKEDIQAAACAIDTLQATIRELDEAASPDLIQSLKDTSVKRAGSPTRRQGARRPSMPGSVPWRYSRNGSCSSRPIWPTRKSRRSAVSPTVLQDIGSDIRIRFDGYTVLKSGKVREKISISLLRDGMDCGSFGKFSAGESRPCEFGDHRAMQKLVNSNCDGDKGLDLLVLDEILEAVDEAGLASMFEALNSLGGTVLVVSHGNVAEGYPHKLVIVKRMANRDSENSVLTREQVLALDIATHTGYFSCMRPGHGTSPKANGATATRCTALSGLRCSRYSVVTASAASWPRMSVNRHFYDMRRLSELRGILLEVCDELDIPEPEFINPAVLKKWATETDTPPKTQMVVACKDRYGIVPVDDNAADACHLFYYYIRRHRL